MASLSYLQPYLESVHARAEILDVPSPVVDALLAQLECESHIYSQGYVYEILEDFS